MFTHFPSSLCTAIVLCHNFFLTHLFSFKHILYLQMCAPPSSTRTEQCPWATFEDEEEEEGEGLSNCSSGMWGVGQNAHSWKRDTGEAVHSDQLPPPTRHRTWCFSWDSWPHCTHALWKCICRTKMFFFQCSAFMSSCGSKRTHTHPSLTLRFQTWPVPP